MRLTLIFPAWCTAFGTYKQVAQKASAFPPINLAIVAAIAQQNGWEVQLIDAQAELLDVPEIIERAAAFQPDLIGLTATTPFFHTASQVAQEVRTALGKPVIFGGVHASIDREKAFLDCFDYLVLGECELTFGDFLRQFEAGNRNPNTPGILSRKDGETVYGGDAPRLENLDLAPLPARELLPNHIYKLGTLHGRKRFTTVQMSRGCPFSCVFCASDLFGKRVRRRSVQHVIQELDMLVTEMGFEHIFFIDDTLTLDRKYILELMDEIERRKLRFTFEGSTRANLWDEPLVRRMQECGLIRISFGLETADLEVRKIIRKEVPLESYVASNRLNNKLGIETINSVMLGLPGETRESIDRTIAFLQKAKDIHHATYGIAMPYPGTEMRRMAEAGQHGLELLETDYSHYQRYGSAVMSVNGLSPEELVKLQTVGLSRIYSCYWRIIPMLKRHGFKAIAAPALEAIKLRIKRGLGLHS
jgi:anaerobic magnesium-protoporphyrin IX monomethyl ester cyclase